MDEDNNNRLIELRAQRDALERKLLQLEREVEQQRLLVRLVAVDGQTPPRVVELAESAAALLLGIVNDALAAMRGAPVLHPGHEHIERAARGA